LKRPILKGLMSREGLRRKMVKKEKNIIKIYGR
jgi:hypothetical protein